MKLTALITNLKSVLHQYGDQTVLIQSRQQSNPKRTADEQDIDHVESFHLHGDTKAERLCCISACEPE